MIEVLDVRKSNSWFVGKRLPNVEKPYCDEKVSWHLRLTGLCASQVTSLSLKFLVLNMNIWRKR